MNILLVEDNATIIKGLNYAFTKNNYNLIAKNSINDAKEYLDSENKLNLIILDIILSDGNSIDFYEKNIKPKNIPTIFLTVEDDENIIVKCLELGAEDYITKPFSTKELLVRIKKILLRYKKQNIIEVKNIKFDIDKIEFYKSNKKLDLTSLEIKLLSLLFLNIGKVVSRNSILETIWENTGNDVDNHTVTVYFNRIREKIGEDIIITVKGLGYRIDEE